jgi:hypothetical protein
MKGSSSLPKESAEQALKAKGYGITSFTRKDETREKGS